METKSIIMWIAMIFLNSMGFSSGEKNRIAENIKSDIRNEVMAMGFKLLIGAVLASVIIYSLIQFGEAFQIFSSQIENGYVVDLIMFGSVTLVASTVLFLMFYRNLRETALSRSHVRSQNSEIDLINLVNKFAEGFAQGLESPDTSLNQTKKHDQTQKNTERSKERSAGDIDRFAELF